MKEWSINKTPLYLPTQKQVQNANDQVSVTSMVFLWILYFWPISVCFSTSYGKHIWQDRCSLGIGQGKRNIESKSNNLRSKQLGLLCSHLLVTGCWTLRRGWWWGKWLKWGKPWRSWWLKWFVISLATGGQQDPIRDLYNPWWCLGSWMELTSLCTG